MSKVLDAVAGWYNTLTNSGSPHTLTFRDSGLILVDATSGNVVINLPSAAIPCRFLFRRIDTSANTVTINRAGSDTFETGQTSVTLEGNAAYRELLSTGGTKWYSPLVFSQGTFTPTARGTGTSGVFTYTVQSGRYERIGQRVFFTVNIGWSASTGTGGIRIKIDAIPFTPVSGHQAPVVIRADGLNYGSGKQLQGYVTSTNHEIHVEAADPAGGATADVSMDTVVGQLIISGSYPTDD